MVLSEDEIKERALLYKLMFETESDGKDYSETVVAPDIPTKARAGGKKGRTGASDFTKGKCAFVRPCTVGWKSQNQPLSRGGGNRTPN
jgi:hypothetical protein